MAVPSPEPGAPPQPPLTIRDLSLQVRDLRGELVAVWALLGFGTPFVGQDLSEDEHVADAPVQGNRSPAPTPAVNITTHDVDPLPPGESPSPGPAEGHPSADEITKLVETARAANIDLEAFGHDMRRLMQFTESQKITKKFLRERMTMDQDNTARAHYGKALR
jgi:hypothetical protein